MLGIVMHLRGAVKGMRGRQTASRAAIVVGVLAGAARGSSRERSGGWRGFSRGRGRRRDRRVLWSGTAGAEEQHAQPSPWTPIAVR